MSMARCRASEQVQNRLPLACTRVRVFGPGQAPELFTCAHAQYLRRCSNIARARKLKDQNC
jgi:hypothetical protein